MVDQDGSKEFNEDQNEKYLNKLSKSQKRRKLIEGLSTDLGPDPTEFTPGLFESYGIVPTHRSSRDRNRVKYGDENAKNYTDKIGERDGESNGGKSRSKSIKRDKSSKRRGMYRDDRDNDGEEDQEKDNHSVGTTDYSLLIKQKSRQKLSSTCQENKNNRMTDYKQSINRSNNQSQADSSIFVAHSSPSGKPIHGYYDAEVVNSSSINDLVPGSTSGPTQVIEMY